MDHRTRADEVTSLLQRWRSGDENAAELLSELIYHQLHRLAVSQMQREARRVTLQPTALVHEVVAQLLDSPAPDAVNREHLYALSARMMRHFLINQANRRQRAKRGGGATHVSLREGVVAADDGADTDLLTLNQLLESLGEQDTRKRDILELYYFGGLSYPEIARATRLSRATVHRELRAARAWVAARLRAA